LYGSRLCRRLRQLVFALKVAFGQSSILPRAVCVKSAGPAASLPVRRLRARVMQANPERVHRVLCFADGLILSVVVREMELLHPLSGQKE